MELHKSRGSRTLPSNTGVHERRENMRSGMELCIPRPFISREIRYRIRKDRHCPSNTNRIIINHCHANTIVDYFVAREFSTFTPYFKRLIRVSCRHTRGGGGPLLAPSCGDLPTARVRCSGRLTNEERDSVLNLR